MVQVSCVYAVKIWIDAGHECPAHSHSCTEVVWNNGCRGTLIQGGQKYPYHEHSVFVYQPGSDHWIRNDICGEQICIGIHGCHAERIPTGVYPRDASMDSLFQLIGKELENNQQRSALDCLAGLVALEFNKRLHKVEMDSPANKAKQYIEDHLTEELSIERIASSVFLSPDYLRQLFKQEFGSSLMHYVIEQRISLAERLLKDSHLKVQDIAQQCGFPNPYYFSRMFKKYRDISPSDFRK